MGGNSAGDPLGMLVWMVDNGARHVGGLHAGAIVTEPGRRTVASFSGVGEVEVTVA